MAKEVKLVKVSEEDAELFKSYFTRRRRLAWERKAEDVMVSPAGIRAVRKDRLGKI
jgi:hypothetical protein